MNQTVTANRVPKRSQRFVFSYLIHNKMKHSKAPGVDPLLKHRCGNSIPRSLKREQQQLGKQRPTSLMKTLIQPTVVCNCYDLEAVIQQATKVKEIMANHSKASSSTMREKALPLNINARTRCPM